MNTKNDKQNTDHKGITPLVGGLGVAVAVAIGATLGVIFAPKEGTETQKDIMEKAKELAKKFKKTRKEVQDTIEVVFGEFSKDLEESYLELQGNILAKIDEIKDQAELTQSAYNEIVEKTVKNFSKGKKWTEKAVRSLIKELQKDWK